MSSNSVYSVQTYTFTDINRFPVMYDKIVCDSQGTVTAFYADASQQNFFSEEIGRVNLAQCIDRHKEVTAIAQRHLQEVGQSLRQVREMEMTIQDSIATGVFQAIRESHIETKRKEEEQRQKIQNFGRFLKVIGENMKYNHFIRLNAYNPQGTHLQDDADPVWYPVKISDGKGVIQDFDVSFQATVARLLLINLYTKTAYPSLGDLVNHFLESRKLRLEFINGLLAGMAVQNGGVVVRDYELYSDGVLVCKIVGNRLSIHNQALLTELCTLPKDRGLQTVIDEGFVRNAIEKGHVPKESERTLRKFIGHTFKDAIYLEAKVYGNVKRVQEIHREEVDALDSLDAFLFDCIESICKESHDEKQWEKDQRRELYQWSTTTTTEEDPSDRWFQLRERYKYLCPAPGKTTLEVLWDREVKDGWERQTFRGRRRNHAVSWNKLVTLNKFLSNESGLSDVMLNAGVAPEILRIVKMFDLAMAKINCMRPKKLHFERGSYPLRQKLLEIRPDFQSFHVFSRTLFPQRLIHVPYLANPKNWFDERVGLQAHLIAQRHISILALSKRMPSFRMLGGSSDTVGIVGTRGNTASGKSSGLGGDPGILNTDPIKWRLRKETPVRNKQIHAEGAMLFDRYFEEVKKDPSFKFIMDLRLLTMQDLNTFILQPAKQRNCPVMLKDMDVPLLTTLNRVLLRNPNGEDPIPTLEAIVSGFLKIRANREEVIRCMTEEQIVAEYHLYHLGKKVAVKEKGEFKVLEFLAYQQCLYCPSEKEVEKDLNRVIDDSYIDEAIARGDIRSEERKSLEKWKVKTVQAAVEIHGGC